MSDLEWTANPKWVAALESGKYKCYKGAMVGEDYSSEEPVSTGTINACCLGVAAIVYAEERGYEWTPRGGCLNIGDGSCYGLDVEGDNLPIQIAEWALGVGPGGRTDLICEHLAGENDEKRQYPLDLIKKGHLAY